MKRGIHPSEVKSAGTHKVPSPILLSGTKVTLGEGLFIVIVVGKDSCVGKIKEELSKDDAEVTPL